MKYLIVLINIFFFCIGHTSADDLKSRVMSMKERAELRDKFLDDRIKTVLPEIMERTGIDMWVIIAREYNEDPVLRTMLPANWINARRRTILVIFNPGDNRPLETFAVARYDVGKIFKKAWDPEQNPDQYDALSKLIIKKNPKKIGINRSEYFAQADGLTSTEYQLFENTLPRKMSKRLVSAEKLAIGWLETRSRLEMEHYPDICKIAHDIIKEGFSSKVVKPGLTTTDDVVWWYRERIRELSLITWFHPTVDLQRSDNMQFDFLDAFSKSKEDNVILRGDLLHVDFGITYLGLNTDTQQLAYVLHSDESEAPNELKYALKVGNNLQDILTNEFSVGRTGNEILKNALQKAKSAGIKPQIYTHPIGYYGHGSGPTIGMWDQQNGVPVNGDYPLYPNTAFSIELNAKVFVKAWNKEIAVMLEEDAFFDGVKTEYIDPRQVNLILIK